MRNNIKLRIGLFVAILFVLAFVFNCRSAKNSVQKSRDDFSKQELKINKIDSISNYVKNNKVSSFDSITWSNYFNQYDISYTGNDVNDFGAIEKTEKGWKFSGKLNVNLKENSNNGDFVTIKNKSENINENTIIKSDSKNQNQIAESKSKIDKAKENKSNGFNWNFTIVLIVGVAVSILGFYVYRHFTKPLLVIVFFVLLHKFS